MQRLKIQNVDNEKEILYWKNPKDIETIINNSTEVWKTINILGFGIGTRIPESLNSDYKFIDFENHTIKIQLGLA